MNTPLTNRPTLKRAALHILYDNGMVNRYHPEAAALAEVEHRLRAETSTTLDAAEWELSALSPAALEEVCCGGDDGTGRGITAECDRVLDLCFEEAE